MGDECRFDEPRGSSVPVRVAQHEPIYAQSCDRLGVTVAMMKHLEAKGWSLTLLPRTGEARPVEARYYRVGVGYLTCKRVKDDMFSQPVMKYEGDGVDQFFHDCCTFMTELPFATGGVVDGPRDGAKGPEEHVIPRGACLGTPPKVDASEAIRTFSTGANRNSDEGKFDYEGFLSPMVLEAYAAYMNVNRRTDDGSYRDSDNWQKGIPLPVYGKSAYRHFHDWTKVLRGIEVPEGELGCVAGLLFNVMGWMFEKIKTDPKWIEREIAKYEIYRENELAARRKK